MQARSAAHPSVDVLAAFSNGKLDETAAQTVRTHLDSCPACYQAAASRFGESFLGRMRTVSIPTRTPSGSVPIPTVSYVDPSVPPELRDHPQYKVVRELGRGGMGVVYLATNKLMQRPEVLKVMNKALLDRDGATERFLREIRSAAMLHHPNIATAYAAFQVGDLLMFAMEYVDGQDLAQVVKERGGPLPVVNACYYIQQAALGLQHAFEKGMIHRDIKPQNLMLARDEKRHVVKVLDFGLAKVMREKGEDTALTGQGKMLGTPDYIAPEQTVDAASADIRADIYSLGCTLHFLLAGHAPFKGRSLFEVLHAHQFQEAKPLHLERPEVPTELSAIVQKMMAKDPARRYQTPVEVVRALLPFVKPGSTVPEKPPPPPPQQPPLRWDTLTEGHANTTEAKAEKRSRPSSKKPSGNRTKIIIGSAAVCLALLVLLGLWAGGVFHAKTKEGTSGQESPAADAARQPPDEAKGAPVQHADFVPLFNGKDLAGWKTHSKQPGNWRVVKAAGGGVLTGSGPETSHLYTERGDYKDFHLRVEARINDGGDSGVYCRTAFGPRNPEKSPQFPLGYEAQIFNAGPRDPAQTGTLYAGLGVPVISIRETLVRNNEWFTMEVIAEANHIVIKVNGKTTVDYTDEKKRFMSGHLALQQRDPQTVAEFRKVEIKEITPQSKLPRFTPILAPFNKEKWRVVADCLEQTSLDANVPIFFGDQTWTDYDFSIDFFRVQGHDQVCLGFWMNAEKKSGAWYGLCSFINTAHTVEWWADGKFPAKPQLQMKGFLHAGGWHTARVSLRGGHFQCFLDGQRLFEHTFPIKPAGCVGLRTWGSYYRFRNIKVTAPDGKVLLEGLPEL